MAERPPLPKISMNRKTDHELLIKQANQALQLAIAEEIPNLNNINLLQYVTAYMKSEKLGKTPKIPKTKSNKRQQPKWKTRIENQIKRMRADLSILTDMAQKGETHKISKKNQRIKKKYKTNFWLKQLAALHQHLLNAYNQAKNKDTENPKNYRSIACLSTSYKVLTSILTERSYTHITKIIKFCCF